MAAEQDWSDVERLISEQKFQAAAERTAERKTAAREAGDEEEWTRALIKEVQLATGLHGYETAVRFLRDEEWPEGALYRAVLHLFYGRSLVTYVQAYSWEIGQRERVETGDEVDLKAWTQDQIAAEAGRAYLAVWKTRGEWGAESLGELAEYVEQNDYPARVRGTLRDAVTYLWVELLADTSLWRPEQSNEIFRLDAAALVAGGDPDHAAAPPGGPGGTSAASLADPAVHPLVKIGAILDDLEAWHGGNGRPEAAFEARLERLRRLRNSLDQEDDRRRIRQDLERRLDVLGRGYEWWSMGMAALAEGVRDDEGDLRRAREIAARGFEAHPESAGGQRCRHVVAAIEASHYELTAMTADGAGRRSIQVRHKNLEALHFRAYKLDLEAVIEGAKDYSFLPGHREVPQIMARQRPAAEWSVELPPTPDYDVHRTFVTPPIEGPGLYLVAASARRDFGDNLNSRAAVNLIVTDLVLLARQVEGEYEITVRSGESGDAVGGVAVSLYRYDWQKGHRRLEERTTGDDGRVSLPVDEAARGSYFVLARRGDDAAILLQLGAYRRRHDAGERTAALLYTDRSVYRPQQKILWKTVAYRGDSDEGRFRTAPDTAFTVELLDANHEVVAAAEARTNAFGSASGEFEIPAGRLLGSWQLRASLGGAAQVQVEEYKRPTFEVTIADPEGTLRLNRPATLRGEVRYYFGLPVASGEVAWRVTREPIYPRWWWWFRPPGGGDTQIVASGATALDADGSFAVTFTPQADERLAGGSPRGQVTYRYRLAADVTDEGGETRSASRAFRLGFVAVEARISSDQSFFTAGRPVELAVLRSDLDGVPRSGPGRYRLVALDQPPAALLPADQPLPEAPADGSEAGGEPYRTAGDLLRPRWEEGASPQAVMRLWGDGEEQGSGTVEHGEDGRAELMLGRLAAGAYRLHYRTRDEFGAEFETAEELVVVAGEGGGDRLALPAVLLAERPSVSVGGTARFLVHSGLPDQEMVFEVYRRRSGGASEPVERRRLRAGSATQVIEIAIGSEHRGGFSVGLTCLRDHQLMRTTENVLVPWDDRELEVEFATFRDLLRPKARETWRVTVRGSDEALLGEGAAEVLAYMYDRSLDLFAPHHPPRPLELYPSRQVAPGLRSSLGSAGPVWRQARGFAHLPGYPRFRGDRLKFYDNYGIGGPGRQRRGPVMMRSMAMAEAPMAEKAAPMAAPPAPEAETATMDYMEVAPPAGRGPEEPAPPAEEPLRSDFAETAFWEPHLLTAADGSVSFEFTVPDSVTEWNVWVHALTRDLRAGSLESRARSVKELMVRPYLPRFFREGDRAELKVVVNNAGETELRGRLDFEILDPETEGSLLAEFGLDPGQASVEFVVPAGGGTDLTFPVAVPQRVGQVAIKAVARAGDLADGELRPLPVLPGRLHLVQSRFAALHDRDRRTLEFADMASDDDPTRADELLVVTLDAQLFYSVLGALPYLVDYPYQCSEQLLNRFLSTGIVASLYDRYPAVSRMAKQLSERETRTESWSADDPNRRMALEETPWLRSARGGAGSAPELTNVLDPAIAAATRDAALAELGKAQTSLGGFPWWPGGPPSPHMTLYILQGFSRALEFGVEVPQEMVVRAWSYLHRHYLDELARRMVEDESGHPEMVTFLNWVLSSYPDESWTGGVFTADDRRAMLDFSFRHWQRHSPLLKGYLALTLKRAGRVEDAALVWDSVMDSAETTRDEGTFWAPEDRAWLWYNDTIETHAFALRTLAELEPADARRHGLVQWLFLNKKLNHWKSTRATAEVIYSLVHYLEAEDALAVREAATVTVGPRVERFEFDPDEYTGKRNQVVVVGSEIDPATMSEVVVEKETPGFLFASATWHFATDRLPEEARGDFFSVERRYFRRFNDGREWVLEPLAEGAALAPGDQLEVQLSLRTKHAAEYVHLRDPRGAGFEPESTASRYKWDLGVGWYEEIRDSGTNFFFDWLPVGEYTFKYRLRANLAGAFRVGPATIQSMYAPEFAAYSSGARLSIGSGEVGE